MTLFIPFSPSRKKFIALQIALIIGMLVALILLYEHFSTVPSKFCTFGKSFDCNIVNKSPYANIDGISYLLTIDFKFPLPLVDISGIHPLLDFLTANAFLGFLTLLMVLLFVNAFARNATFAGTDPQHQRTLITFFLTISILYGVFLIFIQHSILKTYCILCLTLDAVLIATALLWWRIQK